RPSTVRVRGVDRTTFEAVPERTTVMGIPRIRAFGRCILLIGLLLIAGPAPAADRPVNLVFILTDNQGAWTLGCYGNPEIRTPNIDQLAAEGIRFTRALSSNPVCSPTRATFLTGLLPSQHGVHSYLGGEKPSAQMGPDAYCDRRRRRHGMSHLEAE